ncbi:MAG: hypothetical protein OXE84_02945 [Rhodobacteraceae bacterium]|nr:hypothetical protein [Paracoccaceae bacterium]MCY4326897.1 hypothetical protein [Paracoccaceae bacterium]
MPYPGQRATGEGLIALEQSNLFQEFTGEIHISEKKKVPVLQPTILPQPIEKITRVLAIDGSIISETIKNGFPGAEASLVQIALVSIDLNKLDVHSHRKIIPPSAFNQMDKAATLQCVLPGCNVAKSDGTSPKNFFRQSIYEALQGRVQKGHETLLETYRALVSGRNSTFRCPNSGCNRSLNPSTGIWICPCSDSIPLYETDPLRFHERFNEIGPNGEPHGEVMRFLEVILLLNVLRYFASFDQGLDILPRLAFVADGPLAAFGQFAAVVPYIQRELRRINNLCVARTGKNILLFSLIKSGPFLEHFEQLDFDETKGPNGKFAPQTALLPEISYIHEAIVYRPPNAKPWGADTYYGRIVLYKSNSGQRMVINTPKVTPESLDLSNTDMDSYPGLPEVAGIVDRLSTYLFDGGFIPIVRAHSHAAIPLKMGGEIIKSLFDK